ncbi:AraC family transcriptional regulator [Demequina sp. NBRC 110052]|uniref:helix-turn-helix domain-containing protein n=1 Tax=Demequina sp. NBRC 110052 TaxID=1570341 RepID=UPI000A061562|nr:AraC family transcriptional regulator [Demequina sp. NBRC 110052]
MGAKADGAVRAPEFWHDSRFPQLESRRSCRRNSCYRPHTHERFAIGLIDEGSSVFVGRSGAPVPLGVGDVVLIPAGHVHSCNPVEGEWTYQMMLIEPQWLRTHVWSGRSGFESAIQVYRAGDARRVFDDANSALFARPSGLEEFTVLLRRAFDALGGAEVQHAEAVGATFLGDSLRPVLEVLAEQPDDPRLDDLAAAAGMDRYQLIRAVKKATGLTPIAWRNNARVIRARAMLRGGEPIASVAHALGFADQSHLHRVFRAHVASTPGEYIR